MQLELDRVERGVCIVSLKGKPDSRAMREAMDFSKSLLENNDFHTLLLNLENFDFIDSSSVGLIVYTAKMLAQHKKKFALCHLTARNEKALKFTKFDTFFQVFATEQAGLEALIR